MDRNLLLAFALSFLVLSLWSMLQGPPQKSPGESPPGVVQEQQAEPPAAEPAPSPQRFPEHAAAARTPVQPEAPPVREPSSTLQAAVGEQIEVVRPLFQAELDSRGGTIRDWELKRFVDRHGDPIALVWRDGPPAAATPFVELGKGDLSEVAWSVERSDDTEIEFGLSREGVRIRKLYRFDEEGYGFRLRVVVENGSGAEIAPAFLVEWPAEVREGNDFREEALAALHEGSLKATPLASLGSGGLWGFLTGARKKTEPVVYRGEIDWLGVQTPYFLGALFPDQPREANARFVPLEVGKRGVAQLYFDPISLAPGQRAAREFRGYIGPKETDRLEAFAPSAVASINLGWSWVAPLTRGFSWLLHAIYTFIPNYGVAIILLTLLVRGVTTPLTVKQMRSMERMRRIQPKIKQIQEKYADDRQRQSEEMMRLYRQEKVNPLGGCFPMLLQLPVFIGLFYALRSSIDLRQAPFVGWIDDLSAPDLLFVLPGVDFPVRVLPLVMGASMFFQQKITPMQADPAQARMMMILMPVMMTFVSYRFPSGLVLYWMMSNVLAIGHQLWIGRKMQPASDTKPREGERGGKKAAGAAKPAE